MYQQYIAGCHGDTRAGKGNPMGSLFKILQVAVSPPVEYTFVNDPVMPVIGVVVMVAVVHHILIV